MRYPEYFSRQLGISRNAFEQTLLLFDSGATIPFIARYRKEKTEGLTDEQLFELKKWLKTHDDLVARKAFVLTSLKEKFALTPSLEKSILEATHLEEVEDIYLPFKEKRKTRAQSAREAGLLPLAEVIMQSSQNDFTSTAKQFINTKYLTIEDVLGGAKDIIAELISEHPPLRKAMREMFMEFAVMSASVIKSKKDEAIKFSDYFDYHQPIKKIPAHRFLAIMRGSNEKLLRVSLAPAEDKSLQLIRSHFHALKIKYNTLVWESAEDCYHRLLLPSIENETTSWYKQKADKESVKVFAGNIRQLLMAPPLGQKNILAIDPGFRSGCKVVCLNQHGALMHNETIFPHPPQLQTKQALSKISTLVNQYKIEAIAIGDGTAGRETEAFIQRLHFDRKVQLFIVNEDGASVYSASALARKEFPEYDVTVRGAVSIGRRLMDPLAELIKIDPKSVGVGQYQHDVDQGLLEEELNQTVESCVNSIGINVNTASEKLLTYIAGIGPSLAKKITDAREDCGGFKSRNELKKVKGFGDKTFEQSAGFLRILKPAHPLDNSAVHPERYALVEKMAKDVNRNLEELIGNEEALKGIVLKNYISADVGLLTLHDIINELAKPGRDVRGIIKIFEFDRSVRKVSDLETGMILPGMVTNITNFGAFVDVGVKQDGLVHVSQLCDEFVTNVNTVVKLNQHVKVKVVSVDENKKRIQFTMKGVEQN